jgi:hypothetical protein
MRRLEVLGKREWLTVEQMVRLGLTVELSHMSSQPKVWRGESSSSGVLSLARIAHLPSRTAGG